MNPFAGPLPAVIPFSGLTDSSGNLTIKTALRQSFWWAGKLVGEIVTPTTARWRVRVGGGAIGFGKGENCEIAGLIVAPGDTVEINVIGGPPSTAVQGNFVGVQGPTMMDIAGAFSSQPNTLAIESVHPTILLLPNQTLNGGLFVNLQPLPPNTTYVRLAINPAAATTLQLVSATGGLGLNYYSETLPAPGHSFIRNIEVDPSMETLLRLSNTGAGNLSTVLVAAHSDPVPVDAVSPFNNPANGSAVQGPNASASAVETATGTFTLVNGTPGQIIRVFGWSLASDGQGAGGVRTHLIPHTGVGNAIAWHSANPIGATAGNASGAPLADGQNLDFIVDFLPATDSAMVAVSYFQG